MNMFVFLFLISNVILFSSGDQVGDSLRYIDEVLLRQVPYMLKAGRVEVFYLPNFVNNVQTRSPEGDAVTGKIHYFYGNISGLDRVHSQTCREPRWESGNVTLYCSIQFSLTYVKYTGRIQLITPISNGVRFQQKDFSVEGDVVDLGAEIEITSSPHVQIPTLRRLQIVNEGTRVFRFIGIDEVPEATLRYHFEPNFAKFFNEVFYNTFMPYFERAVSSVRYPLE